MLVPHNVPSPVGSWLAFQAPRLERGAFAFVFAHGAGAFAFIDNSLYAAGDDFPSQFSTFTLLSWPAIYLIFVAFLLHRPQLVQRGIVAAPWIVAFPAVAALSTLWSVAPSETVGEAFRLAMTVAIGAYLGVRLTPVAIARLVTAVLGLSVGLSVLLHIAGADFATMVNGSARGLFYHKNTFGNAAVVLIAASAALAIGRPRDPLALAGLTIGFAALTCADSATATVTASLVLVGSAVLVLRARPLLLGLWVGLAIAAAMLVLGVILVADVAPITLLFEALDRDPTLTGRAYLWEIALIQIAERPLLGTGYAAFWVAAVDWRTLLILDLLGQVGHFHNTFLEIGVELGALGLAAAALTLGLYGIMAWRHLRTAADRRAVWTWLFLIVVLATSLTELYAFQKHHLSTILLAALAVSMRVDLLAADGRRYPRGYRLSGLLP